MDRSTLALTAVVVGTFLLACTSSAKSEQAAPWELATKPGPAATRIGINVLVGGCAADEDVLGPVSVEETTETVTITTTIRKPVVSGSAVCPDIGRLHPTSVELDAPLGDRRLLDGTTGAPP